MSRVFLIGVLGVVCLAAVSAAIVQRCRLGELRAEVGRLAQQYAGPEASGTPAAGQSVASGRTDTASVSPELLRLRNEVRRLTALKQELEQARAENERLRLELAGAGTNNVPGRALPPGYVRRANAQLAGYNTPEDTMQSFLWALHHKDSARLLEALTPKAAEWFQTRLTDSSQSIEEYFQEMEAVLGMAVVGKEESSEGHVELRVVVAPGLAPEHFRLESIDGQWKIQWLP